MSTTSTGCYDPFISDGFCDGDHNNEECDWDGGDCCACDCVDADYTCGSFGYDCLDPSACGIDDEDDGDDVPVGAIVGGVIGGVLFLAAIIILVVLFKKGCLKPCACGDSCACCEPGPPAAAAPAPAYAPAGGRSAPSVVKGYPEVYSSAAVAQPPPPAYEGPGNVPAPSVQAYPAAAASAAPPAYGGPVRNQYPAPA
ncbi:unnamed protein product [Ectocarpus sp. 4 AP-2014]